MSNKLVKHQETKEILTGKQKKILFWSCFIILSIAFVAVWVNIFLTSKAFIFSTTTMGKRMIIISECRYRNLYIRNMM